MLAFSIGSSARFLCRVEFQRHSFANVSFFDAECRRLLFHLSLRAEGIAFCAQRGAGAGGCSNVIRQPVVLPQPEAQVEIRFDSNRVQVLLDGATVLESLRFPDLATIAYADFRGGVVAGSVDMRQPGKHALSAASRAALRRHLTVPARYLKQIWRRPGAETALQTALSEAACALHDRPDVPDDLLDNLALPPPRMLPLFYVTLAEPFCQRNAFEQLCDHARSRTRMDWLTPTRDVWFNSGLLPFLLRAGQIDLLRAQLRLLANEAERWLMTAPLAWAARTALDDTTLPGAARDDIIRSYLAFLDRRAPDYWQRTPCLSLIDTAVTLIAAGPRLDRRLRSETEVTILRAYGLMPDFWERIAAAETALPTRLVTARCAFEHLRSDSPPDPAALARFDRAGCSEVIRFRSDRQSNGTLRMLTAPDRLDLACEAPVAVVACMRNEMFMLPHFLAHYRRMGVESFLIADNGSEDDTREYLVAQPDVALFAADTDYGQSQYGVLWQRELMARFRTRKWSLVADADELLTWETPQQNTLPDLLQTPDFGAADAARIFMLDMYPCGPLAEADFTTGDPFAEASFTDRDPFLCNSLGRGPYSNAPTWTSAVRHRLFPGSRPDLFVAQKIALLKYSPFMRLSAGLHYACGVRLAGRELFFGHFKYHARFHDKAVAEAARGQHFNQAEEYRKYLALIAKGRDRIYAPDVSVTWSDSPFVAARLTESVPVSPQ